MMGEPEEIIHLDRRVRAISHPNRDETKHDIEASSVPLEDDPRLKIYFMVYGLSYKERRIFPQLVIPDGSENREYFLRVLDYRKSKGISKKKVVEEPVRETFLGVDLDKFIPFEHIEGTELSESAHGLSMWQLFDIAQDVFEQDKIIKEQAGLYLVDAHYGNVMIVRDDSDENYYLKQVDLEYAIHVEYIEIEEEEEVKKIETTRSFIGREDEFGEGFIDSFITNKKSPEKYIAKKRLEGLMELLRKKMMRADDLSKEEAGNNNLSIVYRLIKSIIFSLFCSISKKKEITLTYEAAIEVISACRKEYVLLLDNKLLHEMRELGISQDLLDQVEMKFFDELDRSEEGNSKG